jgi:hypothetical protein
LDYVSLAAESIVTIWCQTRGQWASEPLSTGLGTRILKPFIPTKRWKQPKCPVTDEWMNTTRTIHVTEYYSAMKKKEILTLASVWMDPEDTAR